MEAKNLSRKPKRVEDKDLIEWKKNLEASRSVLIYLTKFSNIMCEYSKGVLTKTLKWYDLINKEIIICCAMFHILDSRLKIHATPHYHKFAFSDWDKIL
jgi:hypothetical protein